LLALLFAIVLAAGPRASLSGASSCEVTGVERTVAIGDVHGAYDRLVDILQTTGLVNDQLRWTGGTTHLVQTGDVVDRGPDSRKALDLLQALEGQAERAGGQVHQLLGNHEVMRLLGDMRYVTPGEYEAFATTDSSALRERFLNRVEANQRADLRNRTPLGWVEMRLAFGGDGLYGKRLTTLDTMVKIDGVVYVHGGISPAVAAMSCTAINDTVRRELTTDFEKTLDAPLKSLAAREDGPLWYRALSLEPETFAPEVDAILAKQNARAIVVGHTVTPTGRIASRFGGRVLQLDTGMQPAYVPAGRGSAIEYKGGVFTAIYMDRRDELTGSTAQKSPSPAP
jgi:hypothetical protein